MWKSIVVMKNISKLEYIHLKTSSPQPARLKALKVILMEKPFGDLPIRDLPVGNLPFGNLPFGNLPFGDSPCKKSPFRDTPFGESPSGEWRVSGDLPFEDLPFWDSASKHTFWGLPSREYPLLHFRDSPLWDIPLGDLPIGDLPFGDLPNGLWDSPFRENSFRTDLPGICHVGTCLLGTHPSWTCPSGTCPPGTSTSWTCPLGFNFWALILWGLTLWGLTLQWLGDIVSTSHGTRRFKTCGIANKTMHTNTYNETYENHTMTRCVTLAQGAPFQERPLKWHPLENRLKPTPDFWSQTLLKNANFHRKGVPMSGGSRA